MTDSESKSFWGAPESVFRVLAFFLPFFAYVATAQNASYWYDGGEFIAAATQLGLPHPPGSPLAVLGMHTALLLPIGSLAFRAALFSVLCGAGASLVLFEISRWWLRRVVAPPIDLPLALAAAVAFSFSHAAWSMAVRVEVYSLQVLLGLCLVRAWLWAEDVEDDARPVALSLALFGLSLTNHHYLALMTLPIAARVFGLALRAIPARQTISAVMLACVPLALYAFLPLRTVSDGSVLNLAPARDLSSFWWSVSAAPFQTAATQPVEAFSWRIAGVWGLLRDGVGVPLLIVAAFGVYVGVRLRTLRAVTLIALAVFMLIVVGRVMVGNSHGNPDALGYVLFVPALAALLGVTAVGAMLRRINWTTAHVVALFLCLVTTIVFARGAERSGMEGNVETLRFDALLSAGVPSNAIVVVRSPPLAFRWFDLQFSQGRRTDVSVIASEFLGYPGYADGLAARDPELKTLLARWVRTGAQPDDVLRRLARQRPVFLEVDPELMRGLAADTRAHGGMYFSMGPDAKTFGRALTESRRALATLKNVATKVHDRASVERLLWLAYGHLEHARARRHDALAADWSEFGLQLSPEDTAAFSLATPQ